VSGVRARWTATTVRADPAAADGTDWDSTARFVVTNALIACWPKALRGVSWLSEDGNTVYSRLAYQDQMGGS